MIAAIAAGDPDPHVLCLMRPARPHTCNAVSATRAIAVTAIAFVHNVPPDGFTGIQPSRSNFPSRSIGTDSPGLQRPAASMAWNSVFEKGA